jgi:hypothetical protein
VEGERQAVEIDLDVDLGREAPARAAEGLARGQGNRICEEGLLPTG